MQCNLSLILSSSLINEFSPIRLFFFNLFLFVLRSRVLCSNYSPGTASDPEDVDEDLEDVEEDLEDEGDDDVDDDDVEVS